MVSLGVLILALIVLYVLARIFIQKLFIVLYRLTRERDEAGTILGIIFLPGTFVHEISHFLMAIFLLVPAADLDLMPEVEDGGIRLGRVAIGKTDFIRGSLIGLAPIISGGAIIFWAISFAFGHFDTWWIIALLVYLIFEITHTMFSSAKDLFAILELVVFTGIISAALVFFKIYGPFIFLYTEIIKAGPFIQKLSYFLFIPIGLELIFLALFRKVKI